MITKPISPFELTNTALQILFREIGCQNTVRFINQFTPGIGDYTADRDKILGNPTIAQIVAEIKAQKRNESMVKTSEIETDQ